MFWGVPLQALGDDEAKMIAEVQRHDEMAIAVIQQSQDIQGPRSRHGIGFCEYQVLRHLYKPSGQKLRRIDLADKVGLSASGVARLLNPMEKIGLVAKEHAPRDARVSLVALTEAGEQVFKESDASVATAAEGVFSALDGHEKNTLAGIVKRLG